MVDYNVSEIRERFLKLYVPAVADVLDEMGYEFQVCDKSIRPLKLEMKIAGPAFTIKGQRNGNVNAMDEKNGIGPAVIDSFTKGCVAVYDTTNDGETGHWGELWSAGAMAKGCVGAIIDGGIRDTEYILKVGFPIFSKYFSPNDARGRFSITSYNCEISVGNVIIHPGDYVFADYDGIVIIPADLTIQVLEKAERIVDIENKIRVEVNQGSELGSLYKKYGRF